VATGNIVSHVLTDVVSIHAAITCLFHFQKGKRPATVETAAPEGVQKRLGKPCAFSCAGKKLTNYPYKNICDMVANVNGL
jgi:hypothetical protein